MKKLYFIIFLFSGLYSFGQGAPEGGGSKKIDLRKMEIHPNMRQVRVDRHDNMHRTADTRRDMVQTRSPQPKDRNALRQQRRMEIRHERVLQRQRH
jgi:hypothetical protein